MHIIVLAAGASRRLGQPKQLVQLRGRPALHGVIGNALAVGCPVSVVVGANAKDISPLVARTSASLVVNRGWEEGIAASIRAGLAALPPACEAVMIVLGDQVAVTADDLKRLHSEWNGDASRIAAAVYAQQVGVPAIFPRCYFPELSELRGDQGARLILQRNADRLVRVPMPRAATDLDTPEDLAQLTQQFDPS